VAARTRVQGRRAAEHRPRYRTTNKAMLGSTRFARFLVAGGIASAVNIGARWLLNFIMTYEAAICIAYLAGLTTAFALNRAFVFDHAQGDKVSGQYLRFAIVNAFAFVQVYVVSIGLARLVFPAVGFRWAPETAAHVIGVLSPALTSYFAHKKFSFRTDRNKP
jgi:putative flippase GtrA